MTGCHLCNSFSIGPICRDCAANMGAGFHPVICMTCRAGEGQQPTRLSLTWIDRRTLEPQVASALDSMQKNHGIISFVRASCSQCTKEKTK